MTYPVIPSYHSRQVNLEAFLNIAYGFINQSEKFDLWKFEETSSEPLKETLEMERLGVDVFPQMIFFDKNLDHEASQTFQAQHGDQFPIIHLNEEFEGFLPKSHEDARADLRLNYRRWALANNLSTIENLFPLREHLRRVWDDNPEAFYSEFWSFLNANLGAVDLSIIYHDLEEEGDKKKLTYSMVQGQTEHRTSAAGEAQVKLMETFTPQLVSEFNEIEYQRDNGKFMWGILIDKSPALIMGKVFDFSPLTLSIIKGLIHGLQKA